MRTDVIEQLALDAATVEVVRALRDENIRSILLKGAVIAGRLYADRLERPYIDVDLLVAPNDYDRAGLVLGQLGYEAELDDVERPPHAITWTRAAAMVDLHRWLSWCRDDPWRLWRELAADTRTITLGGTAVEAPSDPALILVIAGHAVQHAGQAKPAADLDRAIELLSPESWRLAAEMASRLGATGVLAAALERRPAGARLMAELGLSRDAPPDVQLLIDGAPAAASAFMRLAEEPTAAARLRFIVGKVFPSPAFMRVWLNATGHASLPLAAGYAFRCCSLLRRAPRALWAWRRATRAGAPVLDRLRATLSGALWTWRTSTRVRHQLRGGGLDAVTAPRVPQPESIGLRGMSIVLRGRSLSCLESAIVRQALLAAKGIPRDLVIGVTSPGEEFGAHAWLDGDPDGGFSELLRRPPPQPR